MGRSTVAAWTEPDVEQTAVASAFQRSVIPLLLYFSGHEVLHASAVHGAKGVVGFCAEAGTGKSTLAYGLSTRGFALWADDALALDLSRPLRAVLLPCEPRLRPRSVRFFEAFSFQQYSGEDGEKAMVAGLAVIKRMAGTDDIVQIERLSGGRAFDEVVRHAYRLDLKADRARRKTLIQNYMNIIDSVPVFEIRFRPRFRDFSFVLDAVTELLNAQLERAA